MYEVLYLKGKKCTLSYDKLKYSWLLITDSQSVYKPVSFLSYCVCILIQDGCVNSFSKLWMLHYRI